MRSVRLVPEVGGPVGILDIIIIIRGAQLASDEDIGAGSDAGLRDTDMIQ